MIHFDFLTSPRPVADLSCTNFLRDILWVANQKYKKYYLMSIQFVELQNSFPSQPNVTPSAFCLIDCVYFPEKITHKRGAFRNSKNCVVTNFYYLFAMSHSFHYRAHQIKTTKINKFAFQPVSNTKLSTILQQSRVSKHCYFLLFVLSKEKQ